MGPRVQADLDELLSKHADDIKQLKAKVAELKVTLDEKEHDEIFLLRYVLSHGSNMEKAAMNVKTTLEWREKHAHLCKAAAMDPPQTLPNHARMYFHGCSVTGEPLLIVRAGLSLPRQLMDEFTPEQVLEWLLWYREVAFRRCDAATRRTRKLTKMVSVVDLAHVTLWQSTDGRFGKVQGEAGKRAEELYPQLLAKTVLINLPRFFSLVFGVFRNFMSPRMLEKLSMCPAADSASEDISKCPFAPANYDVATLPSFLGGGCRCEARGGCILGSPNDRKGPQLAAGSDGRCSVWIAARDAHELVLAARAPGDRLVWSFEIEAKGIEFSATLAPGAGGAPITLHAAKKYKAEDQVEGSVVVPAAGTVTVRFDNSYSVMTGKTVKYQVVVVPKIVPVEGAVGDGAEVDAIMAQKLSATNLATHAG